MSSDISHKSGGGVIVAIKDDQQLAAARLAAQYAETEIAVIGHLQQHPEQQAFPLSQAVC